MMSYCITLFMCVALGGIVYAYETTNDTEEAQVKIQMLCLKMKRV
jgi:hypothetical protein